MTASRSWIKTCLFGGNGHGLLCSKCGFEIWGEGGQVKLPDSKCTEVILVVFMSRASNNGSLICLEE